MKALNRKIFYALLPLIIFQVCLLGKIVETAQFTTILDWIPSNQNVVIFCDIDSTLIKADQQLGCEQWEAYLMECILTKGIPHKEAKIIKDIIIEAVQPKVRFTTVDPSTAAIVEQLQKQKILFIGLTARSPYKAAYTFEQLISVGVDLSINAPEPLLKVFPLQNGPTYENGIIYTSPVNKKSDILFAFLEAYGINPERIIFIDDRKEHVEDVEKGCAKRNINCISIHFTGIGSPQFRPEIADIQWGHFPRLLSDEEAQKILEAKY